MALFRKVIFWIHLVVGISVAVVVLMMSITGVLLTYQLQITEWTDQQDLTEISVEDESIRLGPADLLELFDDDDQGEKRPVSFEWRNSPEARVVASFGREASVSLNPYDGQVIGRPDPGVRSFFRSVENWHRWFNLTDDARRTGRSVTGVANLGFLFLVLSGLYLWWPRNWNRRALRNVLWFKRRLSPKARDFNWHNVIGFWSFLPLVFVVGTAVVFSYEWADELVYSLVLEEEVEGLAGEPERDLVKVDSLRIGEDIFNADFDTFTSSLRKRMPEWRSIRLDIPDVSNSNLKLRIDSGNGRQSSQQVDVEIDRISGQIESWNDFYSRPKESQLRSQIRFGHTGEYFGFWGQTLAGLVSLGAAFMVWTGLWLSWRRWRAWMMRRE